MFVDKFLNLISQWSSRQHSLRLWFRLWSHYVLQKVNMLKYLENKLVEEIKVRR